MTTTNSLSIHYLNALMLLVCLALDIPAQQLDPAFEKADVENLFSQSSPGLPFHPKLSISKPELSFHQRFTSRIYLIVEGGELTTRHKGELVFFLQLTDTAGLRYQTHYAATLAKFRDDVYRYRVNIAFDTFLLPGTYTISAAVLDTGKHEFGTLRDEFTVPEPSRYLQANLWQGTPAVEFITSKVSPDNWFLPEIHNGIAWPPPTDRPSNLTVLLNIGQSAHGPATPSEGLPLFLPVISVLLRSISLNISKSLTVLDLSRHRVTYKQSSAPLNWSALKEALEGTANEPIDLRSLAGSNEDAQFFLRSFHSAVSATTAPCTVVILSPRLTFRRGQNLTLLPGEASPCSIFYLRYAVPDEQTALRRAYRAMHPPLDPDHPGTDRDPEPPSPPDQLAETLRHWHPKVIDIESAEQLNNVLRDIAASLQ